MHWGHESETIPGEVRQALTNHYGEIREYHPASGGCINHDGRLKTDSNQYFMPVLIDPELYFIAVIPPAMIFEEVTSFKQLIYDKFGSKGALRSPPHITLHMPFRLEGSKVEILIRELREASTQFEPFPLTLSNFGSFPPRVIFVQVDGSKELRRLHNSIGDLMKRKFQKFNKDHKNNGFVPHMTIGFRDLKKPDFYSAWEIFEPKKYSAQWEVQQLYLLKHNGREWKIAWEIKLSS